jgi:hypothetical protein
MAHAFVLSGETDTDHVFTCLNCGAVLGFNKPGIGTPNAVEVEGQWQVPEGADAYVGPCEESN